MHDFSDKEYWRQRWVDCFPATYPPELFLRGVTLTIIPHKFLFWKWEETLYHTSTICARCGRELMTGHYCKDLQEHA